MKSPNYEDDSLRDLVRSLLCLAILIGLIAAMICLAGCVATNQAELEWARANAQFMGHSGALMQERLQSLTREGGL